MPRYYIFFKVFRVRQEKEPSQRNNKAAPESAVNTRRSLTNTTGVIGWLAASDLSLPAPRNYRGVFLLPGMPHVEARDELGEENENS